VPKCLVGVATNLDVLQCKLCWPQLFLSSAFSLTCPEVNCVYCRSVHITKIYEQFNSDHADAFLPSGSCTWMSRDIRHDKSNVLAGMVQFVTAGFKNLNLWKATLFMLGQLGVFVKSMAMNCRITSAPSSNKFGNKSGLNGWKSYKMLHLSIYMLHIIAEAHLQPMRTCDRYTPNLRGLKLWTITVTENISA